MKRTFFCCLCDRKIQETKHSSCFVQGGSPSKSIRNSVLQEKTTALINKTLRITISRLLTFGGIPLVLGFSSSDVKSVYVPFMFASKFVFLCLHQNMKIIMHFNAVVC